MPDCSGDPWIGLQDVGRLVGELEHAARELPGNVARRPSGKQRTCVPSTSPPPPPPSTSSSPSQTCSPTPPPTPTGEEGPVGADTSHLQPAWTSSEGLLCGMWALMSSLDAQLPPGVQRPSEGELRRLFERFASTENNFYADDIALVLEHWGISKGLSLSLGIAMEAGGGMDRFAYRIGEGTDATIWIHNDNNEMLDGAAYNHYSAMVPHAREETGGSGSGH